MPFCGLMSGGTNHKISEGMESKRCTLLWRLTNTNQRQRLNLDRPNAETAVIATVSPAAKDTEHSLNT
jgi:hypothetical protein